MRYQESEPALISVFFSFLFHLSEVKNHCSKFEKTVTFETITTYTERFSSVKVRTFLPSDTLSQFCAHAINTDT